MSTELYVGPASSGKTAYALGLVREASRGLRRTPRLVVATHLQVRSCRRRLAELGGSIGAKVLTFDRVYSDFLASVGDTHTEIGEPVRHRLIRAVLSELPLDHYAALSGRAGFVRAVADLIAELKSCLVSPDGFAAGVKELGNEPRLLELALAYAAYEDQLRSRGWEDRAGLGWLALRVLKDGEAELWDDWSLVVVDGFAHLTPLQLAVLERLAARVDRLVMTLTGAAEGDGQRPLAYRRFERTRKELERRLGVDAHPLPESTGRATPLAELERQLFAGAASQIPASGGVDLIEAPDRDAEVRAALRWLKARVVQQGMGPGEVALLARDVAPYRPFIRQIADEFALPIRLVDGLPLRANPAVAALLSLIRLVLPRSEQEPEPALPWRQVVASWRSPYFDWSALPEEGAGEPIGVTPRDANLLDAAARWGRVVGGLSQWEEILADLAARPDLVGDEAAIEAADEERGVSAGVPVGSEAQELWAKFGRFLRRVRPPAGEHSYREYVAWLEGLIGPDPTLGSTRYPQPREPTALQVVAMARSGPEDAAERDVAALQLLKDIFRGMVLAEQALALPPIEFSLFFEELAAAVEAMRYSLPLRPEREEILVADVAQARGVPFRAAALLGMAEGEFPAALREDPFLRDSDRQQLRLLSGLPLDPSTLSVESELFYETVAGARCILLLTRPRLADNGAAWQPSPFWPLAATASEWRTGCARRPPRGWRHCMGRRASYACGPALQRNPPTTAT
jgi:ATP-dependent helicase/DNAse subunit B